MEDNRWDSISNNLDRIKKMGYNVSLNWKEYIVISINSDSSSRKSSIIIDILSYDYINDSIDWLDVVEEVIDTFYSWYYENGLEVNNLIKEGNKIEDLMDYFDIINITDRVNREISIQSILSENKKWDF